MTPKPDSSNTARADGIITAAQDIGAYRAQYLGSMNGKVLRLDPATGDGVPSNPFFIPGQPRAPQSRVWRVGSDPFRMTLRPGSGSADPADADPGTLYIGDVGWNLWEELNVASTGGQNFGWPIYEGMVQEAEYLNSMVPENPDAPNPLFGINGCVQERFTFRDLLVLERENNDAEFPQPVRRGGSNPRVDPPLPVPPADRRLVPRVEGVRFVLPGERELDVRVVGEMGSPCLGNQFGGSASVAGAEHWAPCIPSRTPTVIFIPTTRGGGSRASRSAPTSARPRSATSCPTTQRSLCVSRPIR